MASLDYSFFPTGWIKYPEEKTWDRYKHYVRDKSLVQYGASLINTSIDNAAGKVVGAIGNMTSQLTNAIQSVGESVCSRLDDIGKELSSLNRRADMMIEQQRMSNLLLQNIVELLKIPNSEKERQQAITNGIRFLANARINPELFNDALEEFLKAESFQKQDYFVLHRIGCIYLYSEEHIDPIKAFDYFSRAAKYAKVESDPNAVRMANLLTDSVNTVYTQTMSNTNSILLLAANSYEKAAFAAYVADDLPRAIECQQKSNELQNTPQGTFFLSKYQAHENNMEASLPLLEQAVESNPNMAAAVFQEVDMMVRPEIVQYVDNKDITIKSELEEIVHDLKGKMSTEALENELTNGTFASRYRTLKRYKRRLKRQ